MATLNGLYIFVESEDFVESMDVTMHVVERGIDISDHGKRNATTLSLSGEIVGKNAANVLAKIEKMHRNCTKIKYVGRNTFSNCLITELSTSYTNNIWGGCKFSMTLKEVRTASTSYNKAANNKPVSQKAGTKQPVNASKSEKVYHKVKKGDYVWKLVAASNAPYKNLSRPPINGKTYSACDWVMAANPNAFSRKKDFRTLQIGKNLYVGNR